MITHRPMSEAENKSLARRLLEEVVNTGAADRLPEFFAKDCTVHQTEVWPQMTQMTRIGEETVIRICVIRAICGFSLGSVAGFGWSERATRWVRRTIRAGGLRAWPRSGWQWWRFRRPGNQTSPHTRNQPRWRRQNRSQSAARLRPPPALCRRSKAF